MSNRKRKRDRISYAPALAAGAFGLVVLGQLRVQAFGRSEILEKGQSSGRFVVVRKELAQRGSILTADGKPAAAVQEASELGLFMESIPNSPAFFLELGAASGIPAAELMQLRASGQEKVFWRDKLSPERTRAVQAVRSKWRADGISLARAGERSYPQGEALASVVGFIRDGMAQGGLEKAFDRDLNGTDGKTIGMVDRGGEYLPLRMDPDSTPKQDGKDVRLTIDSEIQLVAAAAVRNAVELNKAVQGCAIVIEPETGNILAMANWPSFDPERIGEPIKGGAKFSDYNPSYMAVLEPGSTFKILTLALALEHQRVSFAEQINCKGSLQVWPTKAIRCDLHGGTRAHRFIGPVDAIAKSCNVSAATWARRVGYEAFTGFLRDSGLLEKSGIGLPVEAAGRYNTEEYAKGLQLATFGFGQSLTTSPLALCSAFSMLGNGGVRVKARLVEKVGDQVNPVREAGRLVSEETAASVMLAMEQVFESDQGTGHTLRIPGYRLAGKTGTAQKINPKTGTVEGGGYVSSFVGFVPAERPKATILVMIDNPKMGKYYGATVAGPVFQDIAKAVIRRKSIPPSAVREKGPLVEVSKSSGPDVQVTRRP